MKRGFTLVELTFVLALITVLMGLVIVRFDWGGSHQRTIAEARRLGRAIETYRQKAIAEQKVYWLILDRKQHSWSIADPNQGPTDAYEGHWIKDVKAQGGGEAYYPVFKA